MEEQQEAKEQPGQQEQAKPKGKWFGRGIYGSKDVPIRVLDGLICVLVVTVLCMIVYFTINGGFTVSFDTGGGSEVEAQKLRHGEFVQEPDNPYKPGYEFAGWFASEGDIEFLWDFSSRQVTGDVTLQAHWTPAAITVKFDSNGGGQMEDKQVVFGEAYGELPVPSMEGKTFAGWEYSGAIITEESIVQMTGEHVLTATWK